MSEATENKAKERVESYTVVAFLRRCAAMGLRLQPIFLAGSRAGLLTGLAGALGILLCFVYTS
jgi:hypothetical protein